MPIGAEVHLEIDLFNFENALECLCIKCDEQDVIGEYKEANRLNDGKLLDWWDDSFFNSKCLCEINFKLMEAWKESFIDFTDIFSCRKHNSGIMKDFYEATITKDGVTIKRDSISPFNLEMCGDSSDEIGNQWSIDFALGIALSSRYSPTYLDWAEEHGGGHGISDVFKPDNAHIKSGIEIARRNIEKKIPEFKDKLELVHRLIFY